jgi:hypothetical protein
LLPHAAPQPQPRPAPTPHPPPAGRRRQHMYVACEQLARCKELVVDSGRLAAARFLTCTQAAKAYATTCKHRDTEGTAYT